MNKEQAKERLCAIETEVEKLRRIIDEPEQPEQRTPEEGDVYRGRDGTDFILFEDHYAAIEGKTISIVPMRNCCEDNPWNRGNYTYLGKFDEVFVKISDVRDALSIGTPGETFLEGRGSPAYDASRMALRELNITKD